ncbi:hypothetical protein SLEP1_g28527 [Rubroshorea leprosula]|uniref:Uncharacterized protein n=1 Tax=Rubroshorea leprosula TaxID=152421 RepID=A0AAV5K597_9ROSI|nr:hypothetical protein SLEP1_g28527 [Rubroshorea leprosula]
MVSSGEKTIFSVSPTMRSCIRSDVSSCRISKFEP